MSAAFPDASRFAAAQALSRSIAIRFRDSAGYRQVAAAFADCHDAATADEVGARAADLLGDDRWPGQFMTPLIDALRSDDWFDPPIRTNRDGLRIGAVLFECPVVSIAASVLSADALRARPQQPTVVVPGRLSVVRYWRGGGARLRRWRTNAVGPDFKTSTAPPCIPIAPITLEDGMILRSDGRTTGQLTDGATSDVISLTATVRVDASMFMREYAADTGALVRVAALDDRASRTQMLLALLRHAGRTDAGHCFDEATHDPAFFVRWQAMREWLALDARSALPRLREMTSDPNAEIRAAAIEMAARVEARLACPA